PLQLVPLAPVGMGQAVHEVVPHELVLVLSAQMPLQLCVPAGHCPEQAMLASMQAPLQSCLPDGQEPPHLACTHVALPPVGTVHAVQEDVPQLAGSVSSTHAPLHRWKPVAQATAHIPDTQVAVPCGSPGQFMHMAPHALASSSRAQVLPQAWRPDMH